LPATCDNAGIGHQAPRIGCRRLGTTQPVSTGDMEQPDLMTFRMASPEHPLSSVDRALPVGTRLEEYEIEGVLAQSSVALVYRALDLERKQQVAIKEYMPVGLAQRGAESRVELRESAHAQSFELGRLAFLNEAQMLAGCEHASLLRTLRILQHHGSIYRVMRYCPGPMLSEHRRAMTAMPDEALLRRWFDSLLGALAELHQLGWVHAAVSPGNILMLSADQPVLLDSDAVRSVLISDRTRGMIAALEPCFAPIEQRQPNAAKPLGPWTDLYALAGTLRFCITGQVPAPPAGEAPQRPSEPLGTLWPAGPAAQPGLPLAPPWLSAFDACLAEPAGERPQSVAQLRALLERQDASWRPLPQVRPTPVSLPGSEAVVAPVPPHAAQAIEQAPVVADIALAMPPASAHTDELLATPHTLQAAPTAPVRARPGRGNARWLGGAALMLALAVAAGAWMWHRGSNSVAVTSAPARGTATPAPAKAAALPAGPAVISGATGTVKAVSSAGAASAAATPEPAARPANPAAAAAARITQDAAASRAPAQPAGVSKSAAVAADKPAGAAKPATSGGPAAGGAREPAARTATASTKTVKAAPGTAPAAKTPRDLCAGRARYALLQCMQTQCEKREWSKHEQCVRLRTQRKLS
jgi:serine/threonine protein kinase